MRRNGSQSVVTNNTEKRCNILTNINNVRAVVSSQAARVALLGAWPAYQSPESLVARVPEADDSNAPGFDAGIACCLDIIPRDKQTLSASLHAAYTPALVEQIIRESTDMDPNSETTWWLSMCEVCEEGGIDTDRFNVQIAKADGLAEDADTRVLAARKVFTSMTSTFELVDHFGGDTKVPFGEVDGCIQGAYIAGHKFGVHFHEGYGIWFIGTYEESLGLEDFNWSEEKDEEGRDKSGPVFGSKQFVKCSTAAELSNALAVVVARFSVDKDIH